MEQNITYKQDYPPSKTQQDYTAPNQMFFQVQPRFVNNGMQNVIQPQSFGTQTPVLGQATTQSVAQISQQIHQPPSVTQQLWLLIEWDMPHGGPNTYAVIDVSEMFCQNTNNAPTRDNIHTGKAILVRRGKRNLPATIVIISDDKDFLDTELRTLRELAAGNLNRIQNKKQDIINGQESQVNKKRKLCEYGNGTTPSPPPNSTNVTSNWLLNSYHHQNRVSPTPSNFSLAAPPMTFDQGTQTDSKVTGQDGSFGGGIDSDYMKTHFSKLSSLTETIYNEQKLIRGEREYEQKFLYDIMNQVTSLGTMVREIKQQMDNMTKYQITEIEHKEIGKQTGYVVIGTGDENSNQTIPADHRLSLSNSTSNLLIDELNSNNDSNLSFNNGSRFSFNDTQLSNSSPASTPNVKNSNVKRANSTMTLNNNANNIVNTNTNSAVMELLRNDWKDDEAAGEEDEDNSLVSIGSNKSKVPRHVLRAINWSSYKTATRKLLVTLFNRETLASHSLTGRPSPAFHDRGKPSKNKLDPNIISDIVQTVTKYCNVTESMVRTAITTKCADENKMSRQRMEKELKTMKIEKTDKENHFII